MKKIYYTTPMASVISMTVSNTILTGSVQPQSASLANSDWSKETSI